MPSPVAAAAADPPAPDADAPEIVVRALRPAVGRPASRPPASLRLSDEVGSEVAARVSQVGEIAALEISSAESLAAVAADAISAADEMRLELGRRAAECDSLRREVASLRDRLSDAAPLRHRPAGGRERTPSPRATGYFKGGAEQARGAVTQNGAVMLNWVHFQLQLRDAQATAARLRRELADRTAELRRAEEARRAAEHRERVLADKLEQQEAISRERLVDIRNLQANCTRLQQELRGRVPRAEHDALARGHADALREVEELRGVCLALQLKLKQQEAAANEALEEAEARAAEREHELRRLLREAAEEQHRLMKQLLDAENAVCPELRRRIEKLILDIEDLNRQLAERDARCAECEDDAAAARELAGDSDAARAAAEVALLERTEDGARCAVTAEEADQRGGWSLGWCQAVLRRAIIGDEARAEAVALAARVGALEERLRAADAAAERKALHAAEEAAAAERSRAAELIARQQAALVKARQQRHRADEARAAAEAQVEVSDAIAAAAIDPPSFPPTPTGHAGGFIPPPAGCRRVSPERQRGCLARAAVHALRQ
eukprot:TRINITY_DN26826_c0_g1_i1.p1 TRINITY_DN26826_c0_g1~~TRINITY_DN26826_c0_g1_i1.p1  ORF type:complete len:570 (+),score=271.85 TRINITY_DN26826_c0_g1_i1:50-1711(+)